MPDSIKRPPYLRLVAGAATVRSTPREPHRCSFDTFASPDPTVLGFLLVTAATLRRFASMIARARPRYVFDVRPLPVFESVGSSRQLALREMQEMGAIYVDVLGSLGVRQRRHALIHSGALAEHVQATCGAELLGPLFFLFDSEDDLALSASMVPAALEPSGRQDWDVRVLTPS